MSSCKLKPYYELKHNKYEPKMFEQQNGRVVNLNEQQFSGFKFFANDNNDNDSFKSIALTNIQEMSPFSMLYFSKENMELVQAQIRYEVYNRTHGEHVISNQSPTELGIIMRSIYLQHAKNTNKMEDLKTQIGELNAIVVSWSVPKIISEIKQYAAYVYDTQNLPVPIPHPKNLSSAGTRQLGPLLMKI